MHEDYIYSGNVHDIPGDDGLCDLCVPWGYMVIYMAISVGGVGCMG